ncbi:hypothetical protein Goari_011103, partial [Gossypium aridum]|nr:hypothetical protein [Gossypium aridum]
FNLTGFSNSFLNLASSCRPNDPPHLNNRHPLDAFGAMVTGFELRSMTLGICSIFDAELWSILDGIILLQRRGCDKMLIQSDSLEVVKAIQEEVLAISNSVLIKRIIQAL